jgi:ribosomal protein S18 acetylase RimI-like enzyme
VTVLVRSAAGPADVHALAEILVDCVEGGASVGFMLPLTRGRAAAFWHGMLIDAARGERLVLVAEEETGRAVGTVTLALVAPENQPHRAEITKMLVRRDARHRGTGERLMRAAEAVAASRGKTLLVLDTASADAERLYERLSWQRVGTIPNYALGPGGGLVDTVVFYKELRSDTRRDGRQGEPG